MNDFTKEELELILSDVSQCDMEYYRSSAQDAVMTKIQSMIDNYEDDPWNARKIAQSHLLEAESLISHAICLLGMREDE